MYKQYHISRHQGLGQDMVLILEATVQFTTYILYFLPLTVMIGKYSQLLKITFVLKFYSYLKIAINISFYIRFSKLKG